MLAEGKKNEGTPIIIRDFNPHRVDEVYEKIGEGEESVPWEGGRAACRLEGTSAMKEDGQNGTSATLTRKVVKEKTVLNSNGFFAHPLVSDLPYVETVVEGMVGYDGVLLDDQRIIGLHVSAFSTFSHRSIRMLIPFSFFFYAASR